MDAGKPNLANSMTMKMQPSKSATEDTISMTV
jgi:hypothetical protein